MQSIDQALKDVCQLHEQLTRQPAPDIGPQGFLPFPPGVDPISFAMEEVNRLRELLEENKAAPQPTAPVAWVPRACLFASETHVRMILEIAGVARDDVEVTLHDRELVVRGQRRPPTVETGLQPLLVEHTWGGFERRFAIPSWCEPEHVKARYGQGMLEVNLSRPERQDKSGEFRVEID